MPDTYPNPSVRLVAFEVRFPPVPELEDGSWLRDLEDRVRHEYPYPDPFAVMKSVELGPEGVRQEVSRRMRFASRTKTSAMSVGRDVFIFETGEYRSFEDLRASVRTALEAVSGHARVAGYERVGLRYVNEVRIEPAPARPADWETYLVPSLVSPMCLLEDQMPETYEGALFYPRAQGNEVLFRFGARVGRTVNPIGPLRLPDKGDGPYFLLDIDSYWEHPPTELPEFQIDTILGRTDLLHEAAQDVFEASITDRLRTEVFGGQGGITR